MNKIETALNILRQMVRPAPRPLWALWSAENVKVVAYELARQRLNGTHSRHDYMNRPAPNERLGSMTCASNDWDSQWLPYWAAHMQMQPALHRKIWEFAFIAQVLQSRDLLQPGRRGLGFGCGREPLASIFAARGCSILATDLAPQDDRARQWTCGDQHADSAEHIRVPSLCPDESALNLRFRPVDMNHVPDDLHGEFDFCWSSCALEHLGSIEHGLQFIRASTRCLRPGGVAVHTTEFNLERSRVLDQHPTVLFRMSDFERLARNLASEGVRLHPVLERPGDAFLDSYVDTPPYPDPASVGSTLSMLHLRLTVASFRTTSVGLVLEKSI